MSFCDPLVVLRPYPASTPDAAIVRAVEMAAAVAPRISAIACGVVPKVPRSLFGDALLDVSGMVGEEKRKSATDVERLLTRVADEAGRKGLAVGERIAEMRRSPEVPGVLADHARLFDVAIIPMPEGDYVSRFDAQWYAETIVFGSGRPTIIVPHVAGAGRPVALETIIVAWDKSRTAARAIADAMPVLRAARSVLLLTVTGEKEFASERSGAELARHLALQGVNAVVDEVDAAGRTVGEVLAGQARIRGADLIVMGAYGRSRFREFVLGGATKEMLTHPPTALLLSH